MTVSDHDFAQHKRTIDAMHNVLRVLNSNRSLDEILTHIIAQPRQLLGCDAAAIYCLDQDQRFYAQASEGMDTSLTRFQESLSRSFAEQLTLNPEPNIVPDCERLLESEWVRGDADRLAYVRHLVRRYRAYVAVPIFVRSEMRGALMVYYEQPRTFSADEISLVTAFRDQAALALENTGLHEQVRQIAIADERDRIARDLHDSVTQALYGITLCTEASLRHLAAGDTAAAANGLNQMQGLAHEALHEMRTLIYALHSSFLAERSLIDAIQARIDVIEVQSNIRIDLHAPPSLHVPPPIAEAVYRIVQEALNNVLKHSRARQVTIRLRQVEGCLYLDVCDDGRGFNPRSQPRGLGLQHMADRTAALGGRFAVDSAPGEGTIIGAEIPLDGVNAEPPADA
ncbi:MAG: GAF domain-containing sensor histidine kinase [bacterium]|nr:GAF domain-containing sensor histidine kinase [bacterium]